MYAGSPRFSGHARTIPIGHRQTGTRRSPGHTATRITTCIAAATFAGRSAAVTSLRRRSTYRRTAGQSFPRGPVSTGVRSSKPGRSERTETARRLQLTPRALDATPLARGARIQDFARISALHHLVLGESHVEVFHRLFHFAKGLHRHSSSNQ